MIIGTPKEIKNHEYRVGLTPESAGELAGNGHEVLVETGAGAGIGATDADYQIRGARVVPDAANGIRRLGDGGESEGAAGRRTRSAARRPGALYLPAPCRRRAANPGSARPGRGEHRL